MIYYILDFEWIEGVVSFKVIIVLHWGISVFVINNFKNVFKILFKYSKILYIQE